MLLAEELVALFGFFIFLDRDQIDRAHFLDASLKRLHFLGNGIPIRCGPGGGHLLGSHHVDFRRSLIREGDRDALAPDIGNVQLIFLPDAIAKVVDRHILLGEFDFDHTAFFLQGGKRAPLLAQHFLATAHLGILRLLVRHQRGDLFADLFPLMLQALDPHAGFLDFRFGLFLASHEGSQFGFSLKDAFA